MSIITVSLLAVAAATVLILAADLLLIWRVKHYKHLLARKHCVSTVANAEYSIDSNCFGHLVEGTGTSYLVPSQVITRYRRGEFTIKKESNV